jgi:TetR/AcrR family transcriptional repressor of nem operon
VGHSQADKARNRERILDVAATQLRESGFEGVSIGDLMKAVNLTMAASTVISLHGTI